MLLRNALPLTFSLWRRHVIVGVPLAAFLHTVLQFLYADTIVPFDGVLLLLHFTLGMVVGAVVLVPAFSLQALCFAVMERARWHPVALVLSGGLLQTTLVALWALTVGIEPSLRGRFPLTPAMIGAGFVAGSIVALWNVIRVQHARGAGNG